MSWQGQQRDAAARVEFIAIRSAAEQITCPLCGMGPGNTCLNMHTGEPLYRVPAHDHRIKEARG